MKFLQLTVVSAFLSMASARSVSKRSGTNPQIDILLYNFAQNGDCTGENDSKDVDAGDCESFDNVFWSFWYGKNEHHFRFWHHDDFDSTDCMVAVCEYKDCEGRCWSPGNYPDTHNKCYAAPWGALSAKVKCDGSIKKGETTPL